MHSQRQSSNKSRTMWIKSKPVQLLSRILIIYFLIDIVTSAADQCRQVSVRQQNTNFENTEQFALIAALTLLAKNRDLNSLCYKELDSIKNGILGKKPWAMKVVDAMGVRPPGFLLGQNLWLGSRDTCNAAHSSIDLKISSNRFNRSMEFGILNETAPFDVCFKIAYLDFETPWQVDWRLMPPEKTISWGLCLPASCSIQDIEAFMRFYIKSDSFVERRFLGIDATLTYVKDLGIDWSAYFGLTSVRILFGIISFTFLMIIAAKFLRSKANRKKSRKKNQSPSDEPESEPIFDIHPLLAFIKCYDIEDNSAKIFGISKSDTDIKAIAGIRAVNANIIIPLHFCYFAIHACVNRTTITSQFGRPILGIIFVIINAFFLLSGFLQTYHFLRNRNQRFLVKEATFSMIPVLFLKKLFHRWLRLAPPYYFVVCLTAALYAFLHAVSVYALPTRDDILLVDSWWRCLLFIHNFSNINAIPVSWTWSMACEMQFFIIATIILFAYARSQCIGKILYMFVVIASIATYFYNGISVNFSWEYDVAFNVAEEMYLHTLIRIVPYLVGMFMAWYIVEKPFAIPSVIECGFGNLSLILFGIILSPLCDGFSMEIVTAIAMLLLLRITISLWISWLLLADITKRQFWLSSFLQTRFFQPIGRISYGIYLLNPIIILALVNLTNTGTPLDWPTIILSSAGIMLLTNLAAVVFSLAFELPYCNLSMLILKPNR